VLIIIFTHELSDFGQAPWLDRYHLSADSEKHDRFIKEM
jgi:hypothetical protein